MSLFINPTLKPKIGTEMIVPVYECAAKIVQKSLTIITYYLKFKFSPHHQS